MDKGGDSSRVLLQTHLTPEECWARLDTIATRYRRFFMWRAILFGHNPLLLRRSGERLVIVARRHFARESYGCPFYGRLTPNEGGTLLAGKFRLPPQAWVATTVWYGIWVAIVVAELCFGFREVNRLKLWGAALFSFAVPAALLWWNLRCVRKPDNPVLLLLEVALEATEC